jgi:hypothetical protein
MRIALFLAWLGLFLLPLRAEDWTTSTGKTYKDVQVLSHNAAYVTILYQDGGGRIPLSTLGPDLQKRFGYDPAQAPAIVAATKTADLQDKEALAKEKSRMQALEAQRQKAAADALTAALFSAPSDAGLITAASSPSNSPSYVAAGNPANDSNDFGPTTEIDDWGYGPGYGGYNGYGLYYGYGGYGYGYSYGFRGNRGSSGNHSGMHGLTHH